MKPVSVGVGTLGSLDNWTRSQVVGFSTPFTMATPAARSPQCQHRFRLPHQHRKFCCHVEPIGWLMTWQGPGVVWPILQGVPAAPNQPKRHIRRVTPLAPPTAKWMRHPVPLEHLSNSLRPMTLASTLRNVQAGGDGMRCGLHAA